MTFLEQILKRRHNILSACLLASALCLCGSSARWMLSRQASKTKIIPSPRSTLLPHLDVDEVAALVYPPDLLPGGRNVETPYGTMRVFEWGPEDGEKVLLLHGVGTPAIALGQLAKELVRGGYRVMLFGRCCRLPGRSPHTTAHGWMGTPFLYPSDPSI